MTDNSTLEYYNSHASDYANITKQADMSENYSRFLKHVKTGGSIADIGCGSGRDLKYFRDNGYESYGVDASAELCRIASEYSGCPVTCSDFLSWTPNIQFNAFWANASLLHLTEEEIIRFFITKTGFIHSGGVLYFSMKAGIKEGFDENGRYFTPFSEDLLLKITKTLPKCILLDRWTNSDSLDRKNFTWESIILKV